MSVKSEWITIDRLGTKGIEPDEMPPHRDPQSLDEGVNIRSLGRNLANAGGYSFVADLPENCQDFSYPTWEDSCLESAPEMYVTSPYALTTGSLDASGFSIDQGVSVISANVVTLSGHQYYPDGDYIVLLTDGLENATFYNVSYSGSDLQASDGTPVCAFSVVVYVIGCS